MALQPLETVLAGCPTTTAGGGDFWHIAAAHICCSRGNALGNRDLVCFIGADYRGDTRWIRIQRVKLLYEYFAQIGLPCILAKFDIGVGDGPGETHITYEDKLIAAMAAGLAHPRLGLALRRQILDCVTTRMKAMPWEDLWATTPLTRLDDDEGVQRDCGTGTAEKLPGSGSSAPALGLLPHFKMTTIISNYVHADLPHGVRASRLALIRTGLSTGVAEAHEAAVTFARRKIEQLREAIRRARESSSGAAGMRAAKAILVLYRRGTVNFRQDTTDGVFDQIRTAALGKGLVTVRVAVGLPRAQIRDSDFDLFDVRRSEDSFIPKLFLARFWALVVEMHEVFGVAGPRTGSLDAAAFQGVNSFSWDEPMLEILAGRSTGGWTPAGPTYSAQYVYDQLWQQLLANGMRGIHSQGVLEPASYDRATDSFRALRASLLSSWLDGHRTVYDLPISDEYLPLVEETCRNRLESEEPKMESYNTRQTIRRLRASRNAKL